MAEQFRPEQPTTPETMPGSQPERSVEQTPAPAEKKQEQQAPAQPVQVQPQTQSSPSLPQESTKSHALEEIEHIMEEDLSDTYRQMTPAQQKQFRQEGEKTAAEIETMMYKMKFKSKKVFKLLFAWLKIVPGINNYFLKQEAKLKTDEIVHLKEEIDKEQSNRVK